jgi:hypothetical protein
MDFENISESLGLLSTAENARAMRREVSSLRGVRGVLLRDVADIAVAAWQKRTINLRRDEIGLCDLFSCAFEDGFVAISLLAALIPDDPKGVLELGLEWLEITDDHQTADAIGWLLLGPGHLASQTPLSAVLARIDEIGHPCARRAAVMIGMSLLPVSVENHGACALRARLKVDEIKFVESPQSAAIHILGDHFLRDDAPAVRKALRRVLARWATIDPEAATLWRAHAMTALGGLPKMISVDFDKALKKGLRKKVAR